jgi:hypothetical protein
MIKIAKDTVTREIYHFFILPEPYSPNRNSHLDQTASIDADFMEEVPFGVLRLAMTVLGVIFTRKFEEKFLTDETREQLLNGTK